MTYLFFCCWTFELVPVFRYCDKGAVDILVISFAGHRHSFFLGVSAGVEPQGPRVRACSAAKASDKYSSRCLCERALRPRRMRVLALRSVTCRFKACPCCLRAVWYRRGSPCPSMVDVSIILCLLYRCREHAFTRVGKNTWSMVLASSARSRMTA